MATHDTLDLDRESLKALLTKYGRAGPRYTSYPTAPHFHTGVGAAEYTSSLERLDPDCGFSLYFHIPFCEERCKYCGCFVIPTRRREVARAYLEHLEEEIRLVGESLRARGGARLDSVHLGGGTPTYLAPDELERLFQRLGDVFDLKGAHEISVELDPRVTTSEHIETLRALGTNRVSLGVQDTSPEVQEAIGRRQSHEDTVRCYELCRAAPIDNLNVDLVYGLPRQTEERFDNTLDAILELRPNRLAIFAYAHLPSLRANQKAIDPSMLPTSEERVALFTLAHEKLTSSGYLHVGLDHFALADDELSAAQKAGKLGRNFMGYTPYRYSKVLGFGVSSIGDLQDGYFQNEKKLSRYYGRLDQGELPIERGWLSTDEDRIRRHAITEILCNLRLDRGEFQARFGEPAERHFEKEWPDVEALAADGLIEVTPEELRVSPPGRLLLRNIAMVFDAYLAAESGSGPVYSRTV